MPATNAFNLDGRIILVTGATGGIGQAICQSVRNLGGIVIGADILTSGSNNVEIELDVTNEASWQSAIDTIEREHGRLDGLVNNAGICELADVEATSLEMWQRLQSVNSDGVYLGCRFGLPLLQNARPPGGAIVNMSSVAGIVGGRKLAAYNASKGSVRLLSKSVALHGARKSPPVRCNSVHPAFVETAMIDSFTDGADDPDAVRQRLIDEVPLGRMARAEEIADAVVYLLSPAAAFVTGAELVIDGGLSAK